MKNKFDEPNRNLAQSVARDTLKRFGFNLVGLALVAFGVATAAEGALEIAPGKRPATIPWSQLGVKAGADYKGEGLAVVPTANGARLRCVFQRLEGEATREGLWLRSTVTNSVNDRFRVVAAAVGRGSSTFFSSSSFAMLEKTGTVSIEGQTVRFVRPGLTEEYTVSMDGLRQDFILPERPQGTGKLALGLSINGATVEPTASGAQFVLKNFRRKIAYTRLRVTDATGKELTARVELVEVRNPVGVACL